MISAKELARQLDRFLKSPTCQDARVVVKLPQGEFILLMVSSIFYL